MPTLEQAGIATEAEIEPDTLKERLRDHDQRGHDLDRCGGCLVANRARTAL